MPRLSLPLRLLVVEDSARDAEIVVRELKRGGFDVTWRRVENEADLKAALDAETWDAIVADYHLPQFDGLAALRVLQAMGKDLPFILVSGRIGEELAVAAMRAGARDYVMKDNLARLAPAVARELHEADVRRERRRLENAIREAAREWRATFDAMQEAVALLDGNLRIRRSNKALLDLTGKTWDDIIGQPCCRLLHGSEAPLPDCPAIRAATTLKPETWETKLGDRWADVVADPVLDANGRLAGIVLVVTDITERRRAEDEIRTSEAQLSNALRIARAGQWEYDVASDTFTFHDNFYRIFRTTAEEVGGYTMFSADYARRFCHPDDLPKVGREIEAAIKTDDPYYSRELEHRILYSNGEVGTIAVRFFVVKDAEGRTVKTYGVNQDITARKQAEEAIRISAVRLRRTLKEVINALSSAIEMRDPYTAGHQERVTRLAVAIAREMGLSEQSIEAVQIAGLVHDIGKLSIPAEILSKPSKTTDIEVRLLRTHAEIGAAILNKINFPWPIARIVVEHHERIDGSGYPGGLTGEDLLIESKILAVADTVEAMSAHRPYRPALGLEAALREIREKRGVLYDPAVVDACVRLRAASEGDDDFFSDDANQVSAQPREELTRILPFGE